MMSNMDTPSDPRDQKGEAGEGGKPANPQRKINQVSHCSSPPRVYLQSFLRWPAKGLFGSVGCSVKNA